MSSAVFERFYLRKNMVVCADQRAPGAGNYYSVGMGGAGALGYAFIYYTYDLKHRFDPTGFLVKSNLGGATC